MTTLTGRCRAGYARKFAGAATAPGAVLGMGMYHVMTVDSELLDSARQ